MGSLQVPDDRTIACTLREDSGHIEAEKDNIVQEEVVDAECSLYNFGVVFDKVSRTWCITKTYECGCCEWLINEDVLNVAHVVFVCICCTWESAWLALLSKYSRTYSLPIQTYHMTEPACAGAYLMLCNMDSAWDCFNPFGAVQEQGR